MNKYYVKVNNQWCHKSPLKLILNPILRKLQFFTDKPFVITSCTNWINDEPNFLKYGFAKVRLVT